MSDPKPIFISNQPFDPEYFPGYSVWRRVRVIPFPSQFNDSRSSSKK